VRAALWAHVCDGQAVTLIEGWRDLRDGSSIPHPSLALAPWAVESVAHTWLDMLHNRHILQHFVASATVGLVVDNSALDPDHLDRWHPQVARLFDAFCARQIPFDVLPYASAKDSSRWADYDLLFDLTARAAEDTSESKARRSGKGPALVRKAQRPSGSGALSAEAFADWAAARIDETDPTLRIWATDEKGSLVPDLYVRQARQPSKEKPPVVLVNLSARPRRVLLTGARGLLVGKVVDVLDPRDRPNVSKGVDLDPWQVRLLVFQ
jgi:hypothetical protein